MNLAYAVQPSPDGLAQALIIGSEFVGNGPCALILGDNIFHGDQLADAVRRASELKKGATVFAYPVNDPERYGVVSFDNEGRAHTLEEKPQSPRSRYAVTGLYFYDHNAPDYARSLTPSNRGELEITDLNRVYLEDGRLNVELLGRGTAWLDTGTHESLLQASVFIETLETRQGMKICCPEEIAFRMNYIGIEDLSALASNGEEHIRHLSSSVGDGVPVGQFISVNSTVQKELWVPLTRVTAPIRSISLAVSSSTASSLVNLRNGRSWEVTRAVLGLPWSLVTPLLLPAVYTFVTEQSCRSVGFPRVGNAEFAAILFSGMLVHGILAECCAGLHSDRLKSAIR